MIEGLYINLKSRQDRNDLMVKNWGKLFGEHFLDRVEAIVDTPATKGIYRSHQHCLKIASYGNYSTRNTIIMEDDIIPCKDFADRFKVMEKELPNNWDIFMLGHFTSEQSDFSVVSKHICKANRGVLAMHCYTVNHKSYDKILEEFNNPLYAENLDVMWQSLQEKYNVYMAMPAFCYQYPNYSDNSKCMDEIISKGTKKFFQDYLII